MSTLEEFICSRDFKFPKSWDLFISVASTLHSAE